MRFSSFVFSGMLVAAAALSFSPSAQAAPHAVEKRSEAAPEMGTPASAGPAVPGTDVIARATMIAKRSFGESLGDAANATKDGLVRAANATKNGLVKAGKYAKEQGGRLARATGRGAESVYQNTKEFAKHPVESTKKAYAKTKESVKNGFRNVFGEDDEEEKKEEEEEKKEEEEEKKKKEQEKEKKDD